MHADPIENPREIWLDDVAGLLVALAGEGLLVAESQGDARFFHFRNVEMVGLSRLAPAPLWMPEFRRRKWIPAPIGPLVPVFACMIRLRSGPVLNIMSVTADEHGRILDRSAPYRAFVGRLHRGLIACGGNPKFLAGDPDQVPRTLDILGWSAATASLLLLIPWSGFPSLPAIAGAGLLAMLAAAILWRPRPAGLFRSYDPANPPIEFLPP
jgi:hypothetical protein